MRALIIDDSATMRTIARNTLTRMGFAEIAEVATGGEGLETLRVFPTDLIFVSWSTSAMDGLTFIETCRSQLNQTPIVCVFSEVERSNAIAAIAAGASTYLIKPYTPKILQRCVAELLPDSNANNKLATTRASFALNAGG